MLCAPGPPHLRRGTSPDTGTPPSLNAPPTLCAISPSACAPCDASHGSRHVEVPAPCVLLQDLQDHLTASRFSSISGDYLAVRPALTADPRGAPPTTSNPLRASVISPDSDVIPVVLFSSSYWNASKPCFIIGAPRWFVRTTKHLAASRRAPTRSSFYLAFPHLRLLGRPCAPCDASHSRSRHVEVPCTNLRPSPGPPGTATVTMSTQHQTPTHRLPGSAEDNAHRRRRDYLG